MEPSCLLGLANSHLLLESCAEGLEIRFKKPDVPAHHAEMGNLLSLNPKIHCLHADAEVRCRCSNGKRKIIVSKRALRGILLGSLLEDVCAHASLYGIV